ncbi:outer membrane protein, partial [Rhodopseudomonas sp. B29]|uniref:outer membrane protein n=1 Tax=Rhodopseudomonas sp. B29 TaxID=95607 RepID=UPI001FCBB0DB
MHYTCSCLSFSIRRQVSSCAAAAALTLVAGSAWAQSAPHAPTKAPVAMFDWSGFYAGGHYGYGRGFGRNVVTDGTATASSPEFGSQFGGLQAGYNYVAPSRLLLGVEGDVTFPNYLDDGVVARTETSAGLLTEKLDLVSSLRGRLGYAASNWMVYATAGWAWGTSRYVLEADEGEQKKLRLRSGWAAGAGAEFALAPGWSARIEYLYETLGGTSGGFPSGIADVSKSIDLHQVRIGLNRRIGGTDGPDAFVDPWDTAG